MSDRDTLAELINPHQPAVLGFWCSCGEALGCHIDQHRADIVIAAGWRPPALVITTPAELEALPNGSVVRMTRHMNRVFARDGGAWWVAGPIRALASHAEVIEDGSVTVVFNPEEASDDDQ